MAITPYGFDGSLDEARWALMWQSSTAANHVLNANDYKVTGVAGYRSVQVAVGSAFSRGVYAVNDAVAQIDLPAPTAGQWFLIANLVDWSANTVTPVALPSVTTTTATPTAIPTAMPSGFLSATGGSAHAPLAWVWAAIGTTALIIVDVRTLRPQYLNQGIWGQYGSIPSGPAGARDAWYNVSTNNASVAGRNYLQGATWYNTDADRLERWYGVYSETNQGGSTSPGWYPATSYDNYAGNDVVSSSDEATAVRINPGSSAQVCSWTIGVSIPTWVNIRFDVNVSPNSTSSAANVAGTLSFTLNGNTIGGNKHIHTHLSSGNVWNFMSLYSRALLLPGSNTIATRLSTENASSAAWMTSEAKILVWKE